jgi:DNA-binding Lrp family transcriptional regulator
MSAKGKVTSYVLVVTEVGKEHEVVKELLKIEGVSVAQTVYGEFDVITKVDCENLKDLDAAITKIRKINGIIRTMTLISG